MSDPTAEKPGVLDNFRLRCEHGSVLIPPHLVDIGVDLAPTELKKTVRCDDSSRGGFPDSEIITYPQWLALIKIYGSNPNRAKSIELALDVSECESTPSNNSSEMEYCHVNNILMTEMRSDISTIAPKSHSEIRGEETITINSEVFEVTLRVPAKSFDLEAAEYEGVDHDPRGNKWCWAPSLCDVCRQMREDSVNDLHVNFHQHSFEVIIVPYDPLEYECDVDKYSEYIDARPCALTAGSSSYTAPIPALSRRNPTRRGAGRRGTKTVKINLSCDDLISFVKAKLAERVEDSVLSGLGGHILMCSGKRLTDHSKTLREYGVKRGEPLSLLLSNSNEGLSGLFFQPKADSIYENGFGKNSFLSSGSNVSNVSSSGSVQSQINFVNDNGPCDGDIVKVREVTGCSLEDAIREIAKSRGDVNAACESLFSI